MGANAAPGPARQVCVAALQCPLGDTPPSGTDPASGANIERLCGLIEAAAEAGAQVICLPELPESAYFAQIQDPAAFALAHPLVGHPTLARLGRLAQARQVCLVVPFFEQDGPRYFNSVTVLDADGRVAPTDTGQRVYRKAHIPQGPGYEEKYYFTPGDSGFCVWHTRFACLGVAICWDQWFAAPADCMGLRGAEVLLYPTAIGSEPNTPAQDTQPRWQRAMQGHAARLGIPVVAANRTGREANIDFYGSSFVTDQDGAVQSQLSRTAQGHALHRLDLEALALERAQWGHFRDRRPELYGALAAVRGPLP